jgi:hypothetical protein
VTFSYEANLVTLKTIGSIDAASDVDLNPLVATTLTDTQ